MAKTPKTPNRMKKLKVFRTPIGFHDAYVAAPSQKAALEAWGAEGNLFAQGMAEEVTEAGLMEEPLARPGEVIRRLRGSAAEHAQALGTQALPRKKAGKGKSAPARSKPSRAELDSAEEALEAAEKRQREELRDIDGRIEALERERRTLLRRHEAERDELADARDRAKSAYKRLVRQWDG